jgi:hypothetical protein
MNLSGDRVLGLEISTPFSTTIELDNTGWTGRRRLVFEWLRRFQDKKKVQRKQVLLHK